MTLCEKVNTAEDFILARHAGQEGAALIRFAIMAQQSGSAEALRATVMLASRLSIEKRLVHPATAEMVLKIIDMRWASAHSQEARVQG